MTRAASCQPEASAASDNVQREGGEGEPLCMRNRGKDNGRGEEAGRASVNGREGGGGGEGAGEARRDSAHKYAAATLHPA